MRCKQKRIVGWGRGYFWGGLDLPDKRGQTLRTHFSGPSLLFSASNLGTVRGSGSRLATMRHRASGQMLTCQEWGIERAERTRPWWHGWVTGMTQSLAFLFCIESNSSHCLRQVTVCWGLSFLRQVYPHDMASEPPGKSGAMPESRPHLQKGPLSLSVLGRRQHIQIFQAT